MEEIRVRDIVNYITEAAPTTIFVILFVDYFAFTFKAPKLDFVFSFLSFFRSDMVIFMVLISILIFCLVVLVFLV